MYNQIAVFLISFTNRVLMLLKMVNLFLNVMLWFLIQIQCLVVRFEMLFISWPIFMTCVFDVLVL